jgi:hypothetical protein
MVVPELALYRGEDRRKDNPRHQDSRGGHDPAGDINGTVSLLTFI